LAILLNKAATVFFAISTVIFFTFSSFL
jgi:hypothetical protein